MKAKQLVKISITDNKDFSLFSSFLLLSCLYPLNNNIIKKN